MVPWFGSRMSGRSLGTSLDASVEISSDMCFMYRQGPQMALVTGLSELMRMPSSTPPQSVALAQAKEWAHDSAHGQPAMEVLPSFQIPCVWSPHGGCFGAVPEAFRVREDILCGRRSPSARARAGPAPVASASSADVLANESGAAGVFAESGMSPNTCTALWRPGGKGLLQEKLAIAVGRSRKQTAGADTMDERW
jgi:hypothetical protein